jgi:hypothetical protein
VTSEEIIKSRRAHVKIRFIVAITLPIEQQRLRVVLLNFDVYVVQLAVPETLVYDESSPTHQVALARHQQKRALFAISADSALGRNATMSLAEDYNRHKSEATLASTENAISFPFLLFLCLQCRIYRRGDLFRLWSL